MTSKESKREKTPASAYRKMEHYFFVKYVGSVESIDEDGVVEEGEDRPRVVYHLE